MPISKYDVEVDLAKQNTSHAIMVELIGSNKRVLDVGCSTGYLAEVLGALGNTVSGIEYDAASAESARQFASPVIVGDLEHDKVFDEFADSSFEVVVFGDVLEHLRDPLPVLRRVRQLLTPGGSVVISVPNIAHGDVRLSLLSGRFDYTDVGLLDVTHVRFFTRKSLAVFLRDAGFVAAEVRPSMAPLFATELGVKESDFPAEAVAEVRADPDAEIYQFVLRAVPDDAFALPERLAWDTDEAVRRAARADQEKDESAAAARAQITTLERELAEATGRANDLMDHIAVLNGRVHELERDAAPRPSGPRRITGRFKRLITD